MLENAFASQGQRPASNGASLSCFSEEVRALPLVCVQGLGFVGAAVAVAIASARDRVGRPIYRVMGVDLSTPQGLARIEALNHGAFPFPTTDEELGRKTREAFETGNLAACASSEVFGSAAVVIVDVPLDVVLTGGSEALDLDAFRTAISTIGKQVRPDALIIVETTVPPGATALVVAPILRQEFTKRGLRSDRFKLAHCYERVMPGPAYLHSIVDMPRVYAGIDDVSREACASFLRTIIHVEHCPLSCASSPTASELGKVLENAYRATTIALMEEFAELAERIGVDLFEIVDWIRVRPSHSNIRTPGFGVGGYCLTKDPLIPRLAARELFGLELEFPFASLAVAVNRMAPRRTLARLKQFLGGNLRGKRILLLGISYKDEIGDTRHSPSQIFFEAAREEGAEVLVHDPFVDWWLEQGISIHEDVPPAAGLDAVILAVPHRQYRDLDYEKWLNNSRPLFLDAFNVLSVDQRKALRVLGCRVESVGRGCGL